MHDILRLSIIKLAIYLVTTHETSHYHFGRSCFKSLSISKDAAPVAFDFSSSSALASLARKASSPALTILPQRTHMSILSAGGRLVHLGMKIDAALVLPATRHSLKNA